MQRTARVAHRQLQLLPALRGATGGPAIAAIIGTSSAGHKKVASNKKEEAARAGAGTHFRVCRSHTSRFHSHQPTQHTAGRIRHEAQGLVHGLMRQRSMGAATGLQPTSQSTTAAVAGSGRAGVPRTKTAAGIQERWKLLQVTDTTKEDILDAFAAKNASRYALNVENYIGTVKIPVGLAGPLLIQGSYARGEYYIPMATHEAALVASYNRGMRAITEAGGLKSVFLDEATNRVPTLMFRDVLQASNFVQWASANFDQLQAAADEADPFLRLESAKFVVEGNRVFMLLSHLTGSAAGQNMATKSSDAVMALVQKQSPVQPQYWINCSKGLSRDKTVSSQSFATARGKRVTCEITVPSSVCQDLLRSTPRQIVRTMRMFEGSNILGGHISHNIHVTNGLAAVFLACGQDAACIPESSAAYVRTELAETQDGREAVYMAITMPNLLVGTIGGGTGLPTLKGGLEIMNLSSDSPAIELAELVAGTCLAGEISCAAAMGAHEFSKAHIQLSTKGTMSKSTTASTPGHGVATSTTNSRATAAQPKPSFYACGAATGQLDMQTRTTTHSSGPTTGADAHTALRGSDGMVWTW